MCSTWSTFLIACGASLGSLINEGAHEMESAPWMLLVPATLLTVLLLSFNVLGDGLRAAREARHE